ncbi:MAG TPA: 2-dehydro-3-deoxyphosphogluconate aldolase, partial [Xanthomonadaceae bacterium]|nr:2-dehydro-3-deoxyphosphogluconate aldolase [Xanthomonadaceae bacterium]
WLATGAWDKGEAASARAAALIAAVRAG